MVGPFLTGGSRAARPGRRGTSPPTRRWPRTSSRIGRSVASTVADISYLSTYGIRTFYVYRALELPTVDWLAAMGGLHAGGATLFAQTGLVGAAAAAGFDGIYTYDIVTYGGTSSIACAIRRTPSGSPALRRSGRGTTHVVAAATLS